MLRVLTVIDGARHLLLLLIVHLGVDIAAARQLSEKQRGIGVLSPEPRTVAFVVFVRRGLRFFTACFNSSDFQWQRVIWGHREVLVRR